MITKQKRLYQIDVLYAIGTLLVVFGHSHFSDWNKFEGTVLASAINFVYVFHMPLFFFIAGFLFFNSRSIDKKGIFLWIKEKSTKLLVPYIVLSFVAAVPKYYFEQHSFSGFGMYIFEAIFAPRKGVWGHFWFIPVLLLIYIIFAFWKKLLTDKNKLFLLSLTIIISVILYFLPFDSYWLGFSDIKKAVIFFVAGMISNHVKNIKFNIAAYLRAIIVISLICLSILLFNYFAEKQAVIMITAFFMIYACWNIAELIGENKITIWISNHNFTIYIYSWLFQSVAMVICEKLGLVYYITSLLMFVIGLAGPIVMVMIYERIRVINNRFFDLLLGVK